MLFCIKSGGQGKCHRTALTARFIGFCQCTITENDLPVSLTRRNDRRQRLSITCPHTTVIKRKLILNALDISNLGRCILTLKRKLPIMSNIIYRVIVRHFRKRLVTGYDAK